MAEHGAPQTSTPSPGSRPIFGVSGRMGSVGEVVVCSSPVQFACTEVPVVGYPGL
jgi:hypothetical protein